VHNWGFEWLFRLWKQPGRWRRQLRLPLYVGMILAEKAKGKG
jgi:N-acetylglucosaminyldiphosphoundecaprenol N-acetyl-beta-D-mannosaminyltransferase